MIFSLRKSIWRNKTDTRTPTEEDHTYEAHPLVVHRVGPPPHREDDQNEGGGDGEDAEHDADQGQEPGPG